MRATSKLAVYFAIAVCLWCGPGWPSAAAQDQPTADQKKAKLIRSINAIPDLVAAGILTEEQANNALTKLKVSLADLILASADPPSTATAPASTPNNGQADPAPAAAANHQAPAANKPAPSAPTEQSQKAPAQGTTDPGGGNQPKNGADASCTGKCSCDLVASGGLHPAPAPTLQPTEAQSKVTINGTVKGAGKGEHVRICVNDSPQPTMADVDDKGDFSAPLVLATDSSGKNLVRNVVTAQLFLGNTKDGTPVYGPMSDQLLAGACSRQQGAGSAPSIDNNIDPGNVAVSGTLPNAKSGTVRVCVNDLPQGDPVQVGADGKFPANPQATQKVSVQVGDQVAVQTVSGAPPSQTYSPVSAPVAVGKCSIASSNPNSSPPTLQPLSTTDNGVTVQGAVKSAKNGTVRICVNDRPVTTVGIGSDGSFIAIAKVTSNDKVTAQQITIAKDTPQETYGPVSDEETLPSVGEFNFGRVRMYLWAGDVLSQDQSQFSKSSIYVDFDADSTWFLKDPKKETMWSHPWAPKQLNTTFEARLTALPVTTCQQAATTSSGSSTGTANGGCSTNSSGGIDTFNTTPKAALVGVSAYAPFYFKSSSWDVQDHKYTLFFAPIGKAGIQTLLQTAQNSTNTATATTSQQAQVTTINGETFFHYGAGGVRFGFLRLHTHSGKSQAPDLISYFDVTWGKYENFVKTNTAPDGTNFFTHPGRIGLEGRFKTPKYPFFFGFNSNTRVGSSQGDLRFFFGTAFDFGCLLQKVGVSTGAVAACDTSPAGSSRTGTQSTGGSKGSGASPADTTISIAAGKASQTGI